MDEDYAQALVTILQNKVNELQAQLVQTQASLQVTNKEKRDLESRLKETESDGSDEDGFQVAKFEE